jgi:hypothetical protein
MPRLVWVSPTNFKVQYVTGQINDPNVPAGYILTSGSDGAPDEALQQFVAGINSLCPDTRLAANANAIPTAFYVGDQTQDTVAANLKTAGAKNLWINGIVGGGTGDK